MKVNVIRAVEFQRINNLSNWKRAWKNLEGQGSIPTQVWIHVFSGSFLNWLGLSFIQLYNSYYSFILDHCGVNQSGGNQNDADVEIMIRYVYFTFYFTFVDWFDFQLQKNFIFIISMSKVFYIRFVLSSRSSSSTEMKIHTNDLRKAN